MAFLRVKPVNKYQYIYEVESYKKKGKVKQKTLRFLGKYIRLKKQRRRKFPLEKALKYKSKEELFKELFAFTLVNYGFKQIKPSVFARNKIVANLKTCKVIDTDSGKDVYLNLNDGFFGTYTLKRVLKSDASELVAFVKSITEAGAINKENEHDFKLLQIISEKFMPKEPVKETSFDKFAKEVGY